MKKTLRGFFLSLFHRNIAMNNFHHMGLAKTEQFTAEENKMASIAKALAHPARIAILKVLIQKKACICGDIVDELPLSQSTVSQHLKELKEAGLIKGDIEGVKVCYCIDGDNWATAQSLLQEFFESKVITNTKCC
jgi:DNA-binding transcriptional ArsR family regulator